MSDYEIKVQVDRSQAHQAADAAVADLKRIEDEAKRAATAEEQVAQQQRSSLQRTSQQRISAAADAGRAELGYQQQVRATGDAHEEAGTKGKQALIGVGAESAVATAAMSKLGEMIRIVGQSLEEAQAKSRALADQFLASQDRYREMAFLLGKPLTPEFALQQVQAEIAAGTRPEESLEFRKQFQYRGAQYIGKTLTPDQAEQLQQQAALLAVASGQDVGAAGGIAGLLAGQQDIRAKGGQGTQDVIARYLRGVKILSGGAGTPAQLLPQWQQLMSSGLAKGDEAATLISLMAERDPGQAETYARRALEGLRDTTGETGKFLKGAGVTLAMSPMQAIEQLRPAIAKQKATLGPGADTLTALKSLGFEERQAVGIQMMMDRGKQVYGARGALAAEVTPAALQQATREAEVSQPVAARRAESQRRLAELQVGAGSADIEIVRKQAEASLIRNREIDTTWSNVAKHIQDSTFGMLIGNYRERAIEQRTFEILNMRRAHPVTDARVRLPYTVEDRNREFNRMAGDIRSEGGDPLRDIAQSNRQIAAHVQRQVHAPIPPKPVAGQVGVRRP